MHRVLAGAALGALLCVGALPAQEDIRSGTIKKVDAGKGTLTITSDGKDVEVVVTDASRVFNPGAAPGEVRLADKRFKTGAAVRFKTREEDGKQALVGLM